MLAVFTEQENSNWLQYLLEEFRRINKAEFEISLIHDVHQLPGYRNVVYYTAGSPEGFSVYDSKKAEPDGSTILVEDDIHCFTSTVSNDKRYAIPFDLFWNSFIFLTRLEEYQSENKGILIHSYLRNHPAKNKTVFQKPVVNFLFDHLEKKITSCFPELRFGTFSDPVIELTHDVDYIRKTIQLRGKQTAFNAYNFCQNFYRKESMFYVKKTVGFLFSNPSYWCFDYWTELESLLNKKSVFYIYAKTARTRDFKSWLIDPSYDVSDDILLQNQLKKMYDKGFEIGLHGSYRSAFIPGLLEAEKNVLEKALGRQVTKTRQHWLNYHELKTPYFHENLFNFDSTLGWNDAIGFRSGSASVYRPYDHIHDKPFSFFEIPQMIMDSTIYDYSAGKAMTIQDEAAEMIKNLARVKSAHVSVSWHQRVCSSDYKWSGFYEKIVNNDL